MFLLAVRCHEFVLSALWADDFLPVCDEALAGHALFAQGADEAGGVPVPALEGDESGAALPGDGFPAAGAPVSHNITIAV